MADRIVTGFVFVIMFLAGMGAAAETGESAKPVMNKYFIEAPASGQDRDEWLSKIKKFRLSSRAANSLDGKLYEREDLRWVTRGFTCCFAFMYDRSFYNPDKGQFTIESFLDDGLSQFGGYDMVLLWQGYPRLGVDQRNQFDFYRDMPGGLPAIRDIVNKLHERGIKAAISYNPWDTGTRREGLSDEQALAELVSAIDADAIFLDTMPAAPAALRREIDNARKASRLYLRYCRQSVSLRFLQRRGRRNSSSFPGREYFCTNGLSPGTSSTR